MRETILMVALLVAALILKEAAHIDALYFVVAGIILASAYVAHHFLQRRQRVAVRKYFPWLYSLSKRFGTKNAIGDIEGTAIAGTEIFLVTPDLFNDARNSITQKVVRSNLERGITYFYITRNDTDTSRAHIMEVMQTFREFEQQIKIFAINDLFGSIPTCNILIIAHDAGDQRRVFVELPVEEVGRREWWVEAHVQIAQQWHAKVLGLLENCKPLENRYKPLASDKNPVPSTVAVPEPSASA